MLPAEAEVPPVGTVVVPELVVVASPFKKVAHGSHPGFSPVGHEYSEPHVPPGRLRPIIARSGSSRAGAPPAPSACGCCRVEVVGSKTLKLSVILVGDEVVVFFVSMVSAILIVPLALSGQMTKFPLCIPAFCWAKKLANAWRSAFT